MGVAIAWMTGRARALAGVFISAALALVCTSSAAWGGPLPDGAPPEGVAATSLTLRAGKRTVNHRKPVRLAMRLTADQEPLGGRSVTLYSGSDATGWKRVATAKTGSSGRAIVSRVPRQTEALVAVFQPSGADVAKYAPAETAPASVAVRAKMELDVPSHVLPSRNLTLRGAIAPARAREGRILATIRRARAKPLVAEVDVKPSGRFAVAFKTRQGAMSVELSHDGSERFAAARPLLRRVRAGFPERLREGMRGPVVLELQRMLRDRGYLAPRSGKYDRSTAWAVKTAHREMRIGESKAAGRSLWKRLTAGRGYFRPKYSRTDRHVEADLGRQIVAFIDHGRPEMVMPTSSGAAATPTVLGTYSFYSRQPGINSLRMLHSVYFIRGYAIHGYPSVPDYPASHGCLRLPNWWARTAYDWVELGMKIHVYR